MKIKNLSILIGAVALVGTAVPISLHMRKKYKEKISDKCMEEFRNEHAKENLSYVSDFWHLKVPRFFDRKRLRALKNILSSMRYDYWDCLVIDFAIPIYMCDVGNITYVQVSRRKKAYHTELHIDTFDGKYKQYVMFTPDLSELMEVLEGLLVERRLPALENWNDCTFILFGNQTKNKKKKDEDREAMWVEYKGESDASLKNGTPYEVLAIENGTYRILDDTGEDFLFSPEEFEAIDIFAYNKPHPCPVCRQYEFEYSGCFDICEVCGWEDDNLQSKHPDYEGGANKMSLNQAREAYKKGIWVE